jgi:rSAM/selenodomain-associated transferase 1
MSSALAVFAKAPVPGWAKTRLAAALGAAGAAALAARLLEHTLAVATSAGFDHVELCAAPDANHPALQVLVARHARLATSRQGEGDLGARMERALARLLSEHEVALVIGSDAPALDAGRLDAARRALHDHDAVFVPALDGGYALVGLRRPAPSLFADIAWSSANVMAETRSRARAAGLRWCELEAVADIDEPADLAHLPIGWPERTAASDRSGH